MTVPCVPPVVTISRAARLAWRMRHPFRPGVHAAAAGRPASAIPAPASSPASGCEGMVAPEGGRFLPALPGGKPAVIATTAAAVGAAAGGAALAGAALAGAGSGGGAGSGVPNTGNPNTGNPYTAVPFTGAPAGLNGAFAGPDSRFMAAPGSMPGSMPGATTPGSTTPGTVAPGGPLPVADTAVPIPAPGATLLFAISAVVIITVRQAQRRRG